MAEQIFILLAELLKNFGGQYLPESVDNLFEQGIGKVWHSHRNLAYSPAGVVTYRELVEIVIKLHGHGCTHFLQLVCKKPEKLSPVNREEVLGQLGQDFDEVCQCILNHDGVGTLKGQPGDIKNEIDTYSEACNEKVYNLGVNED